MVEKSGIVFLMDRILAIEGVIIEKYSFDEIKVIIDDILNDAWREEVTLKIESPHRKNIFYKCPYCNIENQLCENQQNELRNLYREYLISSRNDDQYKNGLIDFFSSNVEISDKNLINNVRDVRDVDRLERKLLFYCLSCRYPSSAINLIENRIIC